MTANRDRLDIIGDIHGHADPLRALLAKLGYAERDGAYRHPERRAIFVGDFIDRGPKIRECLQIVRAMADNGAALAVMGNHECDAIFFHTRGRDGQPLRVHNAITERLHRATLDQIVIPFPNEWREWLAWFKALPFALDLGELRVVHAAWCSGSIAALNGRRFTDDEFLFAAGQRGGADNNAVRTLLGGPKIDLPPGVKFRDREGCIQTQIRARWFRDGANRRAVNYPEAAFHPFAGMPDRPVPPNVLAGLLDYENAEPPVIMGHYWMPSTTPELCAPNVACVDYSVADPGGLLVAYRWDGERVLDAAKFVQMRAREK